MTKLTELMDQGYQIQISEHVTPDTVFAFTDPANHGVHEDGDMLVFHPLNYSYLAYDDPFMAHAVNQAWIHRKINRMADEAVERLDRMVDQMNHKYDPKLYLFAPNVEAVENDDGTFTFNIQPYGRSWEEQQKLRREYEEQHA